MTPTSSTTVSSAWLSVIEAAQRSGLHEGHIRRLARDWLAEGKSRRVSGDGKRERYEVREDADPAFARVKFPEQIGTDLRHVTDAKRQTAHFRRQVLVAWADAVQAGFSLGFDRERTTNHFIERLLLGEIKPFGRSIKISRATLYIWQGRWDSGGLAGLVDGRGGTPETAAGGEARAKDDLFFGEVKRLFLLPRRLKKSVCYELAKLKATESGWTVCSYERCRQLLAKIPKGVVLKNRMGEEAYVNLAEPYIERDYTTLSSNEIWCGDHHQFDVLVNCGSGKLVRPWLTAWQDLRSRKIVAAMVFPHDPNTDTILATFRAGCLEHGVPENVYVDNGKDYDSYALNGRTKKDRWSKRRVKVEIEPGRAGVWTGLGVSVTHAWAYHGQSKPIERFFGTLEGSTQVWDTYCGNAPGNKPEDLQLNIERGKAPSLEAFSLWFLDWLATYNARPSAAQGLEGQSPDQVFAACLTKRRTTTAEMLDAACLKRVPPVRVGQNGVTYQGLRYGQYEPALQALLGQQVVLAVDDADLSAVQVWSMDGKIICLAPCNVRLPANATSQELRDAIKTKRQARKAVGEYYQRRPRLADDLPDAILRARIAAAERDAADASPTSAAPPALQPIRSPFESQMPEIRRALEAHAQRATGTDGPHPPSRFVYGGGGEGEGESMGGGGFTYHADEEDAQ